MKKKFFAVFFALLVLCTTVVPVFADEADDWGFSEEYPTAEPTGVTINVYNWGEYISNGTEGSLDVNAEFTVAPASRSTTPRSTATSRCTPNSQAAAQATMSLSRPIT